MCYWSFTGKRLYIKKGIYMLWKVVIETLDIVVLDMVIWDICVMDIELD